jgi:hypothetical protein
MPKLSKSQTEAFDQFVKEAPIRLRRLSKTAAAWGADEDSEELSLLSAACLDLVAHFRPSSVSEFVRLLHQQPTISSLDQGGNTPDTQNSASG